MRKIFCIIFCLSISACKVGPDYVAPEFSFEESWNNEESEKIGGSEEVNLQWWRVFNDTMLNSLINDAVIYNHDIRIAASNVGRAKILRKESKSAFFPSLGAGGAGTKQGLSNRLNSSYNNSGAKERDGFSADLDAGWELDIFGGIRRDVEAANADFAASKENRNAVLLSVLAEVSRNYFEVRGLQKRIKIKQKNIKLLKQVEALAAEQFKHGATTDFNLALARGEREITEAVIPNLEAELRAGIYRLSVLTGKTPDTHLELLSKYESLPTPPDVVPVGLRSEIMRRRPDVVKSERELAAKTARIGVAVADLFPKFSLTGAIGTSAQLFSDLFTGGAVTYALGNNISWSLFEGGALRARISAAEYDAEAALINYEKTVLNALEEVEASLTRYGKEWQTFKLLRAAEKTRRDAFNIVKLRYEEGEEGFLSLLESERSLIATEDSVVQSEARILTSLTQLYKSLGGGWEKFGEL